MRFDYLKTFLTVAKTHSFSLAAKELDLTQGAVSHHIAALEKYFDAEFFKRAANGVEVTDAGAILAEAAEKILSEVEQVKVEVSTTKSILSGAIKIPQAQYQANTSFPVWWQNSKRITQA